VADILLIEDNEASMALVRYLLSRAGHRVIVATTGEAAVEQATVERPDLVLCDLQLPGMDGYAVREALLSRAVTAAIPVVALTALSMRDDRERVRTAGFNGYLTKPIEPESFVADVESFLARPV